MRIRNTTIQNKTKEPRLSATHFIPSHYVKSPGVSEFLQSLRDLTAPKEQIIYSLGCQLLGPKRSTAIRNFFDEYDYELLKIDAMPRNEFDLLGCAYQFLNSKMENLKNGIFYTGEEIANDFVCDLAFDSGEILFDPACGSGSFLFRSNAPASQIYGVDSDPIAIMIAKFNYFIKFPTAPSPNLYCTDFFSWFSDNSDKRFTYIVGNPPYGANLDLSLIPSGHISSGESFSYFIEFSHMLLARNGTLRFLVPESLLNVKRHTDIRDFLLDHTNLNRIKKYSTRFSGVMSDVYLIEIIYQKSNKIHFISDTTTIIPKEAFKNLKNHIFVNLTKRDITIARKVLDKKVFDLSGSVFGLGVVTGDNKSKLTSTAMPGSEHIYTGKEVEKFSLRPPNNFIIFDRTNLQQVAPDEIYRAPAKLIYKTISKNLKIALDTTGSLTTNSANIFIPAIPGYHIVTVMAFLNSDLYTYLNLTLFGGVNKVAKENLQALPFPEITSVQNSKIFSLGGHTITTGCDLELQSFIHTEIFGLDASEIEFVRSQIG